MKNIINYVQEYNEFFTETPLSEVDSLVFCQLCYLRLDNMWEDNGGQPIRLGDLVHISDNFIYSKTRRPNNFYKFVNAISKGKRFADIKIIDYQNIINKDINQQFSVTTYKIDELTYIAFRGTDASVTGWKENMDMFCKDYIPSQIDALKYIEQNTHKFSEQIYIGGHSKGGNLAVFASLFARKELFEKIKGVFNHDGPGLANNLCLLPQYKNLQAKLTTLVPECSVFGLILNNENKKIVSSKAILGIYEHEPFNWEIVNNNFVYKTKNTNFSTNFSKSLNSFLQETDIKSRYFLVDVINEYLTKTNAESFRDIGLNLPKSIHTLAVLIKGMPQEDFKKLKNILLQLPLFYLDVISEDYSKEIASDIQPLQNDTTQDSNKYLLE